VLTRRNWPGANGTALISEAFEEKQYFVANQASRILYVTF
jgi:hypothetical protein